MDSASWGIFEASQALNKKNVSSRELVQASLDSLKRLQDLNAFLSYDGDQALAAADVSDARIARAEHTALTGVPIAVKDNIAVQGLPMTAASKILEGYRPLYEAHVTQKLWDIGAVCLGKTNLDEFGMGSGTLNSAYGPTLNPWRSTTNPETPRVPGGSSGGSAACVAAGIVGAALGTDTGGSIRQPASFCGLVGVKPTYGRCSRRGVVALASSFDTVGPLTRTVVDAAMVLQAIAGYDNQDSTSANKPVHDYVGAVGQSIKGLRVGVPKEYRAVAVDDAVTTLWQKAEAWLQDAGAEVVEVGLPHIAYALQVYSILMCAEASSNLARYDGVRYGMRVAAKDLHAMYTETRDNGFGTEVKRRILTGSYVLSSDAYEAYFQKAQRVRRLIFNDFNDALQTVDCLFFPISPTGAFATDDVPTDPTDMYRRDIFTITTNLAGVPSVAVPLGLDHEGLPLGFQLAGRPFDEATLFKVATVLEKNAAFPRWKEAAL